MEQGKVLESCAKRVRLGHCDLRIALNAGTSEVRSCCRSVTDDRTLMPSSIDSTPRSEIRKRARYMLRMFTAEAANRSSVPKPGADRNLVLPDVARTQIRGTLRGRGQHVRSAPHRAGTTT